MADSIRTVIDEIKEKLPLYMSLREKHYSLRELDGMRSRLFDYNKPLDPPIAIEDIENFESETGVRFPDGLRLFLSEVGSGAGYDWDAGIGPDYGMLSVSITGGTCCVLGEDFTADLTQPFIFTKAYDLEDSKELYDQWHKWTLPFYKAFPPYKINDEGKPELIKHDKAAVRRYRDEHPGDGISEYYNRLPFTGALPICGIGCGAYYFVVVNGEAAGEVWYDYRDSWGGYEPVLDESGEHFEFAHWYLRWLNSAIQDMDDQISQVEKVL